MYVLASHPRVYWGDITVNIANILRDDYFCSVIRPLTLCHKTNKVWERTLHMVDSILLHLWYNIWSILTGFYVRIPLVARKLSTQGYEKALLWLILWYSYLYSEKTWALNILHVDENCSVFSHFHRHNKG